MNELLEFMMQPMVRPVGIALAGGTLAYLLSRLWPRACGAITLLTAAGVLLCGAGLMRTPAEAFRWSWASLGEDLDLALELAPSRLGLLVLVASSAFTLLVGVYSLRAVSGDYWEGKFHAYAAWALAGAALVALAGNLLVLLIGWEMVTLMLFLMICQGKGEARAGGAKAYGVLGFADACLLMALVLLAAQKGGTANWSLAGGPMSLTAMGAAGYVVFALITIAALAKAGAVPLHTWIPSAAEGASAPVMALLPGSMDKLLGVYLLFTVVFRVFEPDATAAAALIAVGCVTLPAAGLMAITQNDLRKALAFDAVSQVGYMVVGVGAGAWLLATGGAVAAPLAAVAIVGALLHMLNHATYKCGLFLMSGTVQGATGTADMRRMGGLATGMPITFACSAIVALSAAGVPPLNGFTSKWMVFQGALAMKGAGAAIVLLAAIFASALSLALFAKMLYAIFLCPAEARASRPAPRSSFLLSAPLVVLSVGCVVLGVRPVLVIEAVLGPAADQVAGAGAFAHAGAQGLWHPAQATGLLLIGLLLGLLLVWVSGRKVRVVRPFLAGEVPGPEDGRFRIPATQMYESIEKLPGIGPALAQGQRGAMDLYHWCGRHGHTLVELLRSQHTGLVNLYVAWCLIGFVATLVYILLAFGV